MPNAFVDEKQEDREHLNYNSMQEQIIYPFEDYPAVQIFLGKDTHDICSFASLLVSCSFHT